jgi:hypothetical protein
MGFKMMTHLLLIVVSTASWGLNRLQVNLRWVSQDIRPGMLITDFALCVVALPSRVQRDAAEAAGPEIADFIQVDDRRAGLLYDGRVYLLCP